MQTCLNHFAKVPFKQKQKKNLYMFEILHTKYLFSSFFPEKKMKRMIVDERELQNWRLLKINEVCLIPEDTVGCQQYKPEITIFRDLLSKFDFLVKNIFFYDESKSFHKILEMKANKKNLDTEDEDLVQNILKSAKNIWDELCNKMKTGYISIYEIEKYRFNIFSDEELYKELVAMNRGGKEDWIKERITQLQRFRMFTKTVTVAKLFLDVNKRYNFDGSFRNLEIIANSVSAIVFLIC